MSKDVIYNKVSMVVEFTANIYELFQSCFYLFKPLKIMPEGFKFDAIDLWNGAKFYKFNFFWFDPSMKQSEDFFILGAKKY